jgi:hypothetical protein
LVKIFADGKTRGFSIKDEFVGRLREEPQPPMQRGLLGRGWLVTRENAKKTKIEFANANERATVGKLAGRCKIAVDNDLNQAKS